MMRSMLILVLGCFLVFPLSTPAADPPRPEHPRPDFRRQAWINLNGVWSFRFDPDNRGLEEGWFVPDAPGFSRTIQVPFPWESKLSGITRPDTRGVAWYRCRIVRPANWKRDQFWLCFGAVDWHATIWVNGQRIGDHGGGVYSVRL